MKKEMGKQKSAAATENFTILLPFHGPPAEREFFSTLLLLLLFFFRTF